MYAYHTQQSIAIYSVSHLFLPSAISVEGFLFGGGAHGKVIEYISWLKKNAVLFLVLSWQQILEGIQVDSETCLRTAKHQK